MRALEILFPLIIWDSLNKMSQEHRYQDLIRIFNACFASYNTRLVKGEGEPVYLPADSECGYHRIEFAHGYFSSGLHEIAHWCIAGEQRRQLVDYGYWYCPDGRNQEQQTAFEKVEVKPQALEWCFSVASGLKFRVSTDNLNGAPVDRFAFQDKVLQQVEHYLLEGLPPRAQTLVEALQTFYQTPSLQLSLFHPEPRLDVAI